MIRAFIAVPLNEKVRAGLQDASRQLGQLGLDARFVKAASLHLTLKFLGNIEPSLVEPIGQALQDCCSRQDIFQVAVEGLGVFPNQRRPRVVWAGIGGSAALGEIQGRVEEQMKALGFKPEDRPFRPHLTLARLRSPRNAQRLGEFLQRRENVLDFGLVNVDRVHLYQSLLKPDGAEYLKLAGADLRMGPHL